MTQASTSDELRADLLQMLWAYIETTQSGVLEWPPRAAESQSTPVAPLDELQMLLEIGTQAGILRHMLGERDGQPD